MIRTSAANTSRMATLHAAFFLLLVLSLAPPTLSNFDPYALNGGLVSAVAGPDYAVVASDTRLTDGGYQILTREHLGSRLWVASSVSSAGDGGVLGFSSWLEGKKGWSEDDGGVVDSILDDDGSVRIPPTPSLPSGEGDDGDSRGVDRDFSSTVGSVPRGFALVGSAGCASDCESLKRYIQTDLATSFVPLRPSNVAAALGQTLYMRRSFPFYSFCVLAGLEEGIDGRGVGAVWVYDAIGSSERVAVGTAGTGREMLQPILDRLFTASSSSKDGNDEHGGGGATTMRRDGSSIPPADQRWGLLGLGPPVRTVVSCDVERAVLALVRGYRSVSEREIGIGDDLVVCILRNGDGAATDGSNGVAASAGVSGRFAKAYGGKFAQMEVRRYPLKKH